MELDLNIGNLTVNSVDVVIRNSEIMCGSMDKNTLGSGTKKSIFYVLLRDFGENESTKSMWRLARVNISLLVPKTLLFLNHQFIDDFSFHDESRIFVWHK